METIKMALTTAEQKKMAKIEKMITAQKKELERLKTKGAQDFAALAVKYDLWKLDKKTADLELKALAKKHKTI